MAPYQFFHSFLKEQHMFNWLAVHREICCLFGFMFSRDIFSDSNAIYSPFNDDTNGTETALLNIRMNG